MTVRKAVFPVAGLGTRFLPATKAVSKEMLPVVDKPLIQYATEEAIEAGVSELIFIVSPRRDTIREHFSRSGYLEDELRRCGKEALAGIVASVLPAGVQCHFIPQSEPRGLGHAVLCAKEAVGGESFAVLLADDLIAGGDRGCLAQMVEVFSERGGSVVAVEEVPRRDTGKYGIVSVEEAEGRVSRFTGVVEKPDPSEAPSNLAVVGRYVFAPQLLDMLERVGPGAGGEIQLTDAIAGLLGRAPVFAYRFDGTRYDCGSKLGMVRATIDFALKDKDIGTAVADHVDTRAGAAGPAVDRV